MKQLNITKYINLGLNVILIFWGIFESKIIVPNFLDILGRMHPLVLHLPIGMLALLVILMWYRKHFPDETFSKIHGISLTFLAFFAVLSALMGLLLSQESGYDKQTLVWHKWTGIIFSLVCLIASEFYEKLKKLNKFQNIGLILLSGMVLWVGHLGGSITHGEDFLIPADESKDAAAETKQTVFEIHINPILKEKCVSCHNNTKTKGDLNMTSIESLTKGGKNGPIWLKADTLNSHILQRAYLNIDDKKHMPPKGKPQLTPNELFLIKTWIAEGADTKSTIAELKADSYFKKLLVTKVSQPKVYSFEKASQSDLDKINTPYCSVIPLSSESPALKASFFVSAKYDEKSMDNLQNIKTQLVSLNLAKMPVNDDIFSKIANFENLEYLNLNQTNITGKGISSLLKCKNLEDLAVSNTKINEQDLKALLSLPKLKNVYIWNTSIAKSTLDAWQKSYPKINFEQGFDLSKSQNLKLNPPSLVNEKIIVDSKTPIKFKHTLKDVNIRYSINEEKVDSTSKNVFTKDIFIDKFTKFNVIATKDGWLASSPVSYSLFISNFKPKTAKLNLKPDVQYPGNGAKTLIDKSNGDVFNLKEVNWLGFRENNFEAEFEFDAKTPKGITVSYVQKIDSYVMPPEWIEIWIANNGGKYTLFKKINVPPSGKMDMTQIKGIDVNLENQKFNRVKIIAKPLAKLPDWHPGKGTKGWFFTDEIYFY